MLLLLTRMSILLLPLPTVLTPAATAYTHVLALAATAYMHVLFLTNACMRHPY